MQMKLIDIGQFQYLKEGDILEKLSRKGNPDNILGRMDAEADKYKIRTINHKKQTLSLVQKKAHEIFTWPNDEERIYTNYLNLLSENTWWIISQANEVPLQEPAIKIYEY